MTNYPPGMTLRPIDAWPLPQQTTDRKAARFDAAFTETLEVLDRELRALGQHGLRGAHGSNWYPKSVLQLALREQDFRNDGMPRANAIPSHPGVILNIEPKDKPALSFPCDTFTRWQDNLRGIALGLEALRKLERYGITQTGQQYTGWRALPQKGSVQAFSTDDAEKYLRNLYRDEGDGLDLGTLPQVYRRVRGLAHPDRNDGDQTRWDLIEGAAAVLRAAGRLP